MFTYDIKIPKERVAVLIGKKGKTKRFIESSLSIKIKINSETGDVILEGNDSISIFNARFVIMAIGRGFNPDIALSLLDEQNSLEIINISEFSKKSKKNLRRLKSRIIGTMGRARETVEQLTNTHISIFGKTIGIIGRTEDVLLAKRALEKLLQGAPHGHVYLMLEKLKKGF